jgi:hypothetical protein
MRLILQLAVCVAISLPVGAVMAGPKPFPEFTFKRQKPPAAGVTKRITIQIEPKPEPDPVVETTPEVVLPEDDRIGKYSWFWQKVSPNIEMNGSVRLRQAFNSLNDSPGVAGPRLQSVQEIARAEGKNILSATIGTKVSPALVLAMIAVESGGRTDAVSPKGAQGLMQLMPDTAKRFGVSNSLSSVENIRGGVAYIDWLLTEFDGDAVMAIAGYNAGEGAVRKHGGVPPYAETRDYVPKVLAAFEVARGLCKTRPELISDGCALDLSAN